jgi:hypothetical protein
MTLGVSSSEPRLMSDVAPEEPQQSETIRASMRQFLLYFLRLGSPRARADGMVRRAHARAGNCPRASADSRALTGADRFFAKLRRSRVGGTPPAES